MNGLMLMNVSHFTLVHTCILNLLCNLNKHFARWTKRNKQIISFPGKGEYQSRYSNPINFRKKFTEWNKKKNFIFSFVLFTYSIIIPIYEKRVLCFFLFSLSNSDAHSRFLRIRHSHRFRRFAVSSSLRRSGHRHISHVVSETTGRTGALPARGHSNCDAPWYIAVHFFDQRGFFVGVGIERFENDCVAVHV